MDIGIPDLLNIIALKEVDLYACRKELAEKAQAFAELEARVAAMETKAPNGHGPVEALAGNWRAQRTLADEELGG